MARTVNDSLTIEADWETLDRGSPEERACFSALGIRCGETWLTQAEDAFVNRVRNKVHLSAYRLAEWLAWNWWRLRWEPRRRTDGWALAHRLTTIGGGYVWPNTTILSDGQRVALLARPTQRRPSEPLRYLCDAATFVPAPVFECAVDRFLAQVREQLRAERIDGTNLERLWADLVAERSDPVAASLRRFEALLGFDPDDADATVLANLRTDSEALGEPAMTEVAADHVAGPVPTSASLQQTAQSNGFDASPSSAVRLGPGVELPAQGLVAAWVRGAAAAKALRKQEHLGSAPLDGATLCRMAGVHEASLSSTATAPLSFALDHSDSSGRIVLRSRWPAGRRFDLARILGDRVAGARDRLLPATRVYTYRQKLQRSFAAELLCPFEGLEEFLAGDYSEDSQREAAERYQVSELTVSTILVNHDRIDRSGIEKDGETPSFA